MGNFWQWGEVQITIKKIVGTIGYKLGTNWTEKNLIFRSQSRLPGSHTLQEVLFNIIDVN